MNKRFIPSFSTPLGCTTTRKPWGSTYVFQLRFHQKMHGITTVSWGNKFHQRSPDDLVDARRKPPVELQFFQYESISARPNQLVNGGDLTICAGSAGAPLARNLPWLVLARGISLQGLHDPRQLRCCGVAMHEEVPGLGRGRSRCTTRCSTRRCLLEIHRPSSGK